MSVEYLTELLLQYRYWIMVPLAFVEGPIVAFIAGTLASAGVFSMYFLVPFFFIRDVGLDGVYYALGHFGGKTRFAQRMMKKIGVTEDHLDQVRALWDRRPGITMFVGKISYGIASSFIVVAGMVRMPLAKFFGYGSIVAVVQYGILLYLGYFLGTTLGGNIAHIIANVQYAVAFAAIVFTAYFLLSRRMRSKFLKKDKEIEDTPV
jgi:membrane-associated protein